MLSYLFCLTSQEAYIIKPFGHHFLFDSFREPEVESSWIQMKSPEFDGKWLISAPPKPQAYDEEVMLYTNEDKKSYGITKKFNKPIKIKTNKSLLIQYELRHSSSIDSGGPLLRLYADLGKFNPKNMTRKDVPLLEFGPIKDGNDHKLVFNFLHRDNSTTIAEIKKFSHKFEMKNDKANHLYTLIIRPNNTFTILYDNKEQITESFFSDRWSPKVNVPMMIPDPNSKAPNSTEYIQFIPDPDAKKPDDFDDRKMIPDPYAVKPENWYEDEPELIPDPSQTRDDAWDDDFDGDWSPSMIPNPKCQPPNICGKWNPPMIENPDYQGEWHPPNITNPKYKGPFVPEKIVDPNYTADENPYKLLPASGVGFMINTTAKKVCMNNIIISADIDDILQWNNDFFLTVQKIQYKEIENIDLNNKFAGGYYHSSGKVRKSISILELIFVKPINHILQKVEPGFDLMIYKNQHPKEALAYLITILLLLCGIIGVIFYQKPQKSKPKSKKKIDYMATKANKFVEEFTRTSRNF